ncbi:hypothetical protein ONZ45_g2741 [Pleurotus djamor]|nr:hypothetical protein ONZ45_g2741 [Pleurotus djamor]
MSSRTNQSTSSGGTKPQTQTQAPAKPRKPTQRVVLAGTCPELILAYQQDGPALAWKLHRLRKDSIGRLLWYPEPHQPLSPNHVLVYDAEEFPQPPSKAAYENGTLYDRINRANAMPEPEPGARRAGAARK